MSVALSLTASMIFYDEAALKNFKKNLVKVFHIKFYTNTYCMFWTISIYTIEAIFACTKRKT